MRCEPTRKKGEGSLWEKWLDPHELKNGISGQEIGPDGQSRYLRLAERFFHVNHKRVAKMLLRRSEHKTSSCRNRKLRCHSSKLPRERERERKVSCRCNRVEWNLDNSAVNRELRASLHSRLPTDCHKMPHKIRLGQRGRRLSARESFLQTDRGAKTKLDDIGPHGEFQVGGVVESQKGVTTGRVGEESAGG